MADSHLASTNPDGLVAQADKALRETDYADYDVASTDPTVAGGSHDASDFNRVWSQSDSLLDLWIESSSLVNTPQHSPELAANMPSQTRGGVVISPNQVLTAPTATPATSASATTTASDATAKSSQLSRDSEAHALALIWRGQQALPAHLADFEGMDPNERSRRLRKRPGVTRSLETRALQSYFRLKSNARCGKNNRATKAFGAHPKRDDILSNLSIADKNRPVCDLLRKKNFKHEGLEQAAAYALENRGVVKACTRSVKPKHSD
jgi:hypothetical protein